MSVNRETDINISGDRNKKMKHNTTKTTVTTTAKDGTTTTTTRINNLNSATTAKFENVTQISLQYYYTDGDIINCGETATETEILRAYNTVINALQTALKARRDKVNNANIYCYLQFELNTLRYIRANLKIVNGVLKYGDEFLNLHGVNISDIVDYINGGYCVLLMHNGEKMTKEVYREICKEYGNARQFDNEHLKNNELFAVSSDNGVADIAVAQMNNGANCFSLLELLDSIRDSALYSAVYRFCIDKEQCDNDTINILIDKANGDKTRVIAERYGYNATAICREWQYITATLKALYNA